ncbi:MAG: hypothetical protein ABUT39_10945 [Acidobacteriota bacterium]
MKKLCLVVILFGCLLGVSGRSFAIIGTIDPVPAATLLFPYFEVDIAHSTGMNTVLAINNAYDSAALAHVTLWTDQSVPALSFDVYLTGYDSQLIDLRDLFVNGNVPVTACDGQDPKDTISPQGPISQDINFPGCWALPYAALALNSAHRAHLQAWFQGNQSPATGDCAGAKWHDNVLRGYVTVDVVDVVNWLFPSDGDDYISILAFDNVLWGDVVYVDPDAGISHAETAVHIEACEECFEPGDHTFYGRYNANNASDAREALPTTMSARYSYFSGFPSFFGGQTDFFVWREGNAAATGYNCTQQGPSSWYPLESEQMVIFDMQEQPVTSEDCPLGDPTCTQTILIPNEANRIDVAADLLSPFNDGWVYLNLQHLATTYPDQYAQMWLITTMDADGWFSIGYEGTPLDNANDPITTRLPVP